MVIALNDDLDVYLIAKRKMDILHAVKFSVF